MPVSVALQTGGAQTLLELVRSAQPCRHGVSNTRVVVCVTVRAPAMQILDTTQNGDTSSQHNLSTQTVPTNHLTTAQKCGLLSQTTSQRHIRTGHRYTQAAVHTPAAPRQPAQRQVDASTSAATPLVWAVALQLPLAGGLQTTAECPSQRLCCSAAPACLPHSDPWPAASKTRDASDVLFRDPAATALLLLLLKPPPQPPHPTAKLQGSSGGQQCRVRRAIWCVLLLTESMHACICHPSHKLQSVLDHTPYLPSPQAER